MSCLHFYKNNLESQKGFTLLEMLLVITISSLLTVVFMQLIITLYQNNEFFIQQNTFQLDAYLAVDFISEKIKNSKKIEISNQKEIEIFTYYNDEYQWLKFSLYQSNGNNSLGRSIGGNDLNNKDFGKRFSLLDKIEDLNFECVKVGLLKITLFLKLDEEQIIISRLVEM